MDRLEYLMSVMDKFLPNSGFDIAVADESEQGLINFLNLDGAICCCEVGKGVLLGYVFPYIFNTNVKIAQELAFYVEPEYRNTRLAMRLYREYEAKARDLGATKITMALLEASNPDKVDRLYRKLGFKPVEHIYIKE